MQLTNENNKIQIKKKRISMIRKFLTGKTVKEEKIPKGIKTSR